MLRSHLSRAALLASVAIVLCAGVVQAQAPALKNTAKLPVLTGGGRPDVADFKENRRAAVPFKALPMEDPKTGKKLGPNDKITLPNGKVVPASEYIAQANSIEKKLNEYGYSLRKKNGVVVLSEAKMPTAELTNQSAVLRKAIVASGAAPVLKSAQATFNLNPAVLAAAESTRLQKLTADVRPTKPVTFLRTWNYEVGKRSLAAGFIDGKLQFHGDRQIVKLNAEANAGGYLVNHRMVLLSAKGSAESPAKGNSRATLNVSVKGQSIFNLDKSIASTYTETKKLTRSFDQSTTFNFSIGPFPVSGKIGTRGSAGVDFSFAIRQAHAEMHIKPNVNSKVYAQFGLDLYLVRTGIGGDLTLVKDTLDLGAKVGLDFDSKGAYISQNLYLHNQLEMLSGNFYLYVRVNYLFDSDEWRKVIWNWDGLRVNGYLFNINNRVYLNPVGAGGVLATR